MNPELAVGSIIVIDGIAFTVEIMHGTTRAYATAADHGKSVWFAQADAMFIGAGLWGLRGRIEPPADASITLGIAEVNL